MISEFEIDFKNFSVFWLYRQVPLHSIVQNSPRYRCMFHRDSNALRWGSWIRNRPLFYEVLTGSIHHIARWLFWTGCWIQRQKHHKGLSRYSNVTKSWADSPASWVHCRTTVFLAKSDILILHSLGRCLAILFVFGLLVHRIAHHSTSSNKSKNSPDNPVEYIGRRCNGDRRKLAKWKWPS